LNMWKRTLFRLGERIHGWNVLEIFSKLKDMETWTPERIEAFQLDRLKKILDHAYHHVPFYRELWNGKGVSPHDVDKLTDLRKLPKTHKTQLLKAGDDVLDRTVDKRKFMSGRSSGSTGEPFVYYKTKFHHSWFIAGAFSGWSWAGWKIGDPWVRLQYRGNLGWSKRVEDKLFNCLYMPIDKLDDDFLHSFMKKAVRFRPVMLRGYAGGIYLLADFLLRNPSYALHPQVVVSTGDTLYPHYRKTIETAFQSRIFDMYGGEGMAVANQCEHGAFHLLPSVYVEFEPEGTETPDGPLSRILLTSLTNTAMPMIRYDIGDIGIPGSGPCPCGRSWKWIKKLIGREVDIIVTKSGRHLLCHHFNIIIQKIDGIEQFQVVQDTTDGIVIRLAVNNRYRKDPGQKILRDEISLLGGGDMEIRFEYPKTIPLPPSGKRRYIISSLGDKHGA